MPGADCKIGDPGFAFAVGIAARWVMGRCGFTGRRLEKTIAAQLTQRAGAVGETLQQTAVLAVAMWERFVELKPQIRIHWGPSKFFSEAHWLHPEAWPYERAKLAELKNHARASVGTHYTNGQTTNGFDFGVKRVREHLERVAAAIEAARIAEPVVQELREIAVSVADDPNVEKLDAKLTELEEKLFAGLLASASEQELAALREQGAREAAPYRQKMQAEQIEKVQRQLLQKRLLEARGLPRLSLFYMRPAGEGNGDSRADHKDGT